MHSTIGPDSFLQCFRRADVTGADATGADASGADATGETGAGVSDAFARFL